jgi:hypothetical protein
MGLLSSRGLFQVLNWGAIQRHIAAAKLGPCRAADMGFREIQVEALPGDVMAGGGGAAGPAPDIGHQPPGDASIEQCTTWICNSANLKIDDLEVYCNLAKEYCE